MQRSAVPRPKNEYPIAYLFGGLSHSLNLCMEASMTTPWNPDAICATCGHVQEREIEVDA